MRIPAKMPRHRKALNKCYLSPSAPSCFSSFRYSGYNLVPDNWELEAMARICSKHTKMLEQTGCDLLTTKNFSPTPFMCYY